jgi:uncharacterized protein DUF6364
MARRNLTVQLDEDVIKLARVIAAKRGTSVSGLVAQEIEDLAAREERYEEAFRRAREVMTHATAHGGRRWSRQELHER